MSKRRVFLDFDGVLNHEMWLRGRHARGPFDPACCARLTRLCRSTGASLVISSMWRLMQPMLSRPARLAWLRGLLHGAGVDPGIEIVGVIPDLTDRNRFGMLSVSQPRHVEIRAYLKRHPVDSFVVLDDDEDADVPGHFVKTDFGRGLQDEDVERAVEILMGGVARRLG